nr:immunoglobulin heavy chain junction region [Macaca mulatta]
CARRYWGKGFDFW